jgi:hypothetical protein
MEAKMKKNLQIHISYKNYELKINTNSFNKNLKEKIQSIISKDESSEKDEDHLYPFYSL